jgi:hypothetical protein
MIQPGKIPFPESLAPVGFSPNQSGGHMARSIMLADLTALFAELSLDPELNKLQDERDALSVEDLKEVDIVASPIALISTDSWRYPQRQFYADGYKEHPPFLPVTHSRAFSHLATIASHESGTSLREPVEAGLLRMILRCEQT